MVNLLGKRREKKKQSTFEAAETICELGQIEKKVGEGGKS